MKSVYFSIFFMHYNLIRNGWAGKLWAACSSSITMAFTITLCIHFLIGRIIGKHLMILYHSTLFGTIFMLLLTILNFMLFVKNNNYLRIESNFKNDSQKFRNAIFITIIYFFLVVSIIVFIGFGI